MLLSLFFPNCVAVYMYYLYTYSQEKQGIQSLSILYTVCIALLSDLIHKVTATIKLKCSSSTFFKVQPKPNQMFNVEAIVF